MRKLFILLLVLVGLLSCTMPVTYEAQVIISCLDSGPVTFTVDGESKTATAISNQTFTVTWQGDQNNGETVSKGITVSTNTGQSDDLEIYNGEVVQYEYEYGILTWQN